MTYYALITSRFALILLSLTVIIRCIRSMLSEKYEPEVWAYMRVGSSNIPITHWENLIGRSKSVDILLDREGVSRVHAVLVRSDKGVWKIYDIFSRGGVWVNSFPVIETGTVLQSGDSINLGGTNVRFLELKEAKRMELEGKRTVAGRRVSPALTLFELTVFQAFLLLQHVINAAEGTAPAIALGFFAVIVAEWVLYNFMRIIGRSGFEVETLGFYLTTLGVSCTASSVSGDMYKLILLILVGVLLFLLMGWWLRNLRRTSFMRLPMAVGALALLAVNVALGYSANGSQNWLMIGGFSFQPSELVKVAYVYVGAAALDNLYRRKNLIVFIAFSAVCVMALAVIGDFGTALVFFISFLVISFMRSGSIATVFLAVSGAGLAGFLAVSVKPYIAQRFASWGHVWEDVYDAGYQQTRAMSAAASGGLFGKGAGSGWLHEITAANADMVFAMLCEELGLIVALCAVAAILVLAFFTFRSVRNARSGFYAISACAAVTMMLIQLSLNVFGSLDILPFTGVTFPFVSHGGTSLLSCWMLLAFIKGADNRKGASFAVRGAEKYIDADKLSHKEDGK